MAHCLHLTTKKADLFRLYISEKRQATHSAMEEAGERQLGYLSFLHPQLVTLKEKATEVESLMCNLAGMYE